MQSGCSRMYLLPIRGFRRSQRRLYWPGFLTRIWPAAHVWSVVNIAAGSGAIGWTHVETVEVDVIYVLTAVRDGLIYCMAWSRTVNSPKDLEAVRMLRVYL